MRYAYSDLGEQREGASVDVRWSGSAADVLLLDPVNFSKYCEERRQVFYSAGGRYGRPPARVRIPQDGHWYVVADLRGYSVNAKATVEVLERDGMASHEEAVVEVA
jgi:hypothetical protein